MQNMTPQQKDIVKAGIVLAVLIFAGVCYYYFYWAKSSIQMREKQVAELQKDIKKIEQEIRDIEAQFGNPEELKAKRTFLEKIARKLPDRVDAQGFFEALVAILGATNIDYSELTPKPPISRSIYTEIPYEIRCKARYHDFGHFLNLIEENPNRFMRVKTFTIENQAERPSIHPILIEVATFMFVKKG